MLLGSYESDNCFKRHAVWDGMGISSLAPFERIVSRISLKPVIPQDIVKRVEVVKRLILHSYFEYEFLDAALTNTVLTFEMALKIRYREIENRSADKSMDLNKLIKWAADRYLFDDEEQIIQNLREIRNEIAHPDRYSLMGYLSIDMIQRTIDIINGMYEDIELRKSRIRVEKETNSQLKEFTENGAILELKGIRLIVFLGILLWYDNTLKTEKFYFLFWPIFNPIPKDGKVDESKPIVISCNSWKLEGGFFLFKDSELQNKVRLVPLDKEENVKKFENWKRNFEQSEFPLKQLISFRIAELRNEARSNFVKS